MTSDITLETLSAFFGWLTVLHLVFFTLTTLLMLALHKFVAKLHGRMFGLEPEVIQQTIYRWLGTYKLLIFTTALGPWIALQLI